MRKFTLISLCLFHLSLFGQNGSQGNPFTALGHAYAVPSSGIYYFDIDGTAFSTYVEAGDGWVLVASGSGATIETSYQTTSDLTLQSDEILPSSVYTSNMVTDVRINATAGPEIPFDVQSNYSGVLSNLQNDRTLSVSTNHTNWTGTGTNRLQRTCNSVNTSLSTNIYHACGLNTNVHWLPQYELEKINPTLTETNDLNLWIRAAQVSLPVEIIQFKATGDNGKVNLRWQTASETNNDYFTIEKSGDGRQWEGIGRVKGAGNATIAHNYSFQDERPSTGVSYYRLKQTDFDGQFSYSSVQTVRIGGGRNTINVYPNPTRGQVTLEGNMEETGTVKVFNMLGQEVYPKLSYQDSNTSIDLTGLPYGVYMVCTNSGTSRIFYQQE